MMIKKTRVWVRTDSKSLRYLPVCMLAWLRSSGRLCTPSNELKWWTPWWRPYMPFWCWKHRSNTPKHLDSMHRWEVSVCVCVCECFTCGRPVRMVERLGEQLLTEVKALLNTRLRWARERRWGVWTTELLYTSVSKPASSAGGGETDTFISSYTTYS